MKTALRWSTKSTAQEKKKKKTPDTSFKSRILSDMVVKYGSCFSTDPCWEKSMDGGKQYKIFESFQHLWDLHPRKDAGVSSTMATFVRVENKLIKCHLHTHHYYNLCGQACVNGDLCLFFYNSHQTFISTTFLELCLIASFDENDDFML